VSTAREALTSNLMGRGADIEHEKCAPPIALEGCHYSVDSMVQRRRPHGLGYRSPGQLRALQLKLVSLIAEPLQPDLVKWSSRRSRIGTDEGPKVSPLVRFYLGGLSL